MQTKHYTGVLYLIIGVILITLGTQTYWSYKNYQSGKQVLINDVQTSLDNAVDRYYSDLAKENTYNFITDSIPSKSKNRFPRALRYNSQKKSGKLDSINIVLDSLNLESVQSIAIVKDDNYGYNESFSINSNAPIDTIIQHSITINDRLQWDTIKSRTNTIFLKKDSLQRIIKSDSLYFNVEPFQELTSKIIFSFLRDSLSFDRMNTLVNEELERKRIDIDYGMSFTDPVGHKQVSNKDIVQDASLHTISKSVYLPKNSILKLSFMNETATILKKNLLGILVSFLLISSVIACLLYLLRIIRTQKQIAEIKNDLISNITHEFKTPIAAIHTALEGIQSFNKNDDPEKTKNYLQLSSQQLGKLNTMVEKLLETATLDNEALILQKEEVNLVVLLEQIMTKYQEIDTEKIVDFNHSQDQIWLTIDAFHFENAIDNLLDNAFKYGGNTITITLQKQLNGIEITVADTGSSLTKTQAVYLFEKFYRVPKGNTHDVKGFGIGLFYTKTIVEKHKGTIQVQTQPHTQFKINLPHVQN